MADPLLTALRTELYAAADPEKAPAMQAYMKSEMPFLGIMKPELRRLCLQVFKEHPIATEAEWQRLARALWHEAAHREERYAALGLIELKKYEKWHTLAALPLYEEFIVSGAWWDYVDEIAAHRLGPLVLAYPTPMKQTMRAWSQDENLWKRRSAILCQLSVAEKIDLPFLYDCIAPSLASTEVFLRKAIGWALRSHAWRDPDEIVRYVQAHKAELSPLSQREALKNLVKTDR